ncbi:MAG: hypothetical protein DRG31_02175 [Deltaproteobacteria bacterium]|nr:MAG: hypothetical protein DRG31_02175 [Deltaproteobacteria bacterium]
MEDEALTRLQRERKLQQRRLLLIVAFLGTFFGGMLLGMILGVKIGGRTEIRQIAKADIGSANRSQEPEPDLTFYERLEEPSGPAPERTVSETPRKTCLLQVASFRERHNALKLSERLRSKGLIVEVRKVEVKGTRWHRVLVKAKDPEEAQRLKGQLEKEGFKGIRILEGG